MKYPLIEKLGLDVTNDQGRFGAIVSADDLERVLSEGKRIVDESDLEEVWDLGNGEWFAPSNTEKISSRYENKAYLIKSSIQPIKKETAEDLLCEMLSHWDAVSNQKQFLSSLKPYMDRARNLHK